MSNREQYQGQPAAGYKPLEEWGQVKSLSNEELEVWKRSPVTRLESRVLATFADLEAENARLQEHVKRLEITVTPLNEELASLQYRPAWRRPNERTGTSLTC